MTTRRTGNGKSKSKCKSKCKSNRNGNGNGKRRFPSGMTTKSKGNRRSFDCVVRGETANHFAQDDTLFGGLDDISVCGFGIHRWDVGSGWQAFGE